MSERGTDEGQDVGHGESGRGTLDTPPYRGNGCPTSEEVTRDNEGQDVGQPARTMGAATAALPDRPSPSGSRRVQRLTPKQRQAGLERLKDPAASERKIALRAGYADWTSLAVKRNGIDSLEFAKLVGKEAGITVAQARKIGLDTLRALAEDRNEAGGTRGASAKALLDYSTAVGEDPSASSAADVLAYHRAIVKHSRRILRWVRLYGLSEAERRAERFNARVCANDPLLGALRAAQDAEGPRRKHYRPDGLQRGNLND